MIFRSSFAAMKEYKVREKKCKICLFTKIYYIKIITDTENFSPDKYYITHKKAKKTRMKNLTKYVYIVY